MLNCVLQHKFEAAKEAEDESNNERPEDGDRHRSPVQVLEQASQRATPRHWRIGRLGKRMRAVSVVHGRKC